MSTLKANTIASLSWSGGSPDDQILLDRLRKFIANASRTELLSPEIASVTFYPEDSGLSIGVDWIGLRPTVDAIRLNFADGSTHDVLLTEEEGHSHQRMDSKTLFFEAWFSDTQLPETLRPKLTDGLIAVVLQDAGRAISETCMPPTYVDKEYHGSVAVEFVDGVVQYDFSTERVKEPSVETKNAS